MAYTVALPDGRTVEFPDSVPREKAAEIIRQQLGGAGPESGGVAAFKAGLESLKGSTAALLGKTGIMDVEEAAKYQREREAEAKRIFKPTEQGWTEAPLTKLAELGGGSAPYMLAPLVGWRSYSSASSYWYCRHSCRAWRNRLDFTGAVHRHKLSAAN